MAIHLATRFGNRFSLFEIKIHSRLFLRVWKGVLHQAQMFFEVEVDPSVGELGDHKL